MNHKGDRKQGEDRLSSLPDNILISILSRLPLRSAIVTECLSSQWRGLWTNITSINIKPGTTWKYSDEFLNALDEIRSRIVSPCIHSFSFEFIHGVQGKFKPPYFDSWVQQICDRNIRELKLTWRSECGGWSSERRQFPSFIFETQSLVSIELISSSEWDLPDDCEPIKLPNLKNLGINICPSTCEWVEKQIQLCPSLEQLSLACDNFFRTFSGVRIVCSNQNLRRLSINFDSSAISHNVVINAPKIEYLAIRAPKMSTFSFATKPIMLREAKINIFGTTTPLLSNELNHLMSKFYEDISNVGFLIFQINSQYNVSSVFHNTTQLTLTLDNYLPNSISIVLSMLELCIKRSDSECF